MELTFYRHHSAGERFRDLTPVKIPFHELIIFLRGHCHYKINGEDVFLHDRDIMYIPMGCTRARKEEPVSMDYISIHFLCDKPLPLPIKIPEGICSCIPALIMSADQIWSEFYPNALPLIQPIIQCILDYTQANLTKGKESPLIRDLRQFMLANLHRKFQAKDIASQALLSTSYCNAVFKRETGMPIMAYYTHLRMQEARRQLIANVHSLKEIAENLGFDDYNLFARTFKKYCGLTPTQYRRKFSL